MKLKKVLGELFKSVNKPIKTIIICDPGLDDLLMLLQILSSPDYHVAGIIPVYGNAKTYYTVQNTVNLCEFLDKTNVPVYPGSGYDPNEPDQDKKTAVYGREGLGPVTLPVAEKMQAQNMTGIEFAIHALTKEPHLIISTASTTEPSKILQQLLPASLKNIIAISMMAAVINPTQEANWPIIGTEQYKELNDKQVTEANLGFDPPSSKIVFEICSQYKIPIILAPLDLTHSILASESDLDVLKKVVNPAAELTVKLIADVPDHYQLRFKKGPDNKFRQPLHDVHSSSCLMHPELYHGHWATLELNNKLPPRQCTMTSNKAGNVFLLQMHYMYRQDYFMTLASDLKRYDYLQSNAEKKTILSASDANLLTEKGIFSPALQTAETSSSDIATAMSPRLPLAKL